MATAEFIGSVVSLIVFYILIAIVGIAASIWFRRKHKADSTNLEYQLIAGRKLGSVVGWLTMSGE